MNLPDLPWTWIGGATLALVVAAAVIMGRRRGRGRHRDQPSGAGHGAVHGSGAAGPLTGEQRALHTAANAVREALDRQARELGELRTFWSRRLDALDQKIAALAPAPPRGEHAPDRRPVPASGGDAAPYGGGMYADGPGWAAPPEPAWSPGPGDQPVEVRDGVLVVSRSLPPAGYLSASGSGQARVYLNAEVPLTEFSLPKWAAFFDLQQSRPYAMYRTRRPAEVRWDAAQGRGELISKGMAEAI